MLTRQNLGIVVFAMALPCHAQNPSYVGIQTPPLPEGCRELQGGIVSWGKKDEPVELGFGKGPRVLGSATVECGSAKMEWLSVEVGRTIKGIQWEVVSVLRYPPIPKGFAISFGIDCRLDGESDHHLMVVAKWKIGKRGGRATVRHAWVLDVDEEKYRSVSVERIKCEYDDDRD